MIASNLLDVHDLNLAFGGLRATVDVSFGVRRGEITALIGPNGAGKTTLFNLITSLIRPDSGRVIYDGQRIDGLAPVRIAQMGLIRTFQTARVFPGMTVLDNLMVGRHRRLQQGLLAQLAWSPAVRAEERELRKCATELLDLVGLGHLRNQEAQDLPMGAQKLLDVLRALMAKPRLLLLDEPAAGLNDSETTELAELLLAIRDTGVTVLIVEHNMPLVMGIADAVVALEAGAVVACGTAQEIQTHPQVLRAYLGEEVPA
ncbi:ABC transporter ATP-binding protein [Thiomonas delicata]|uniref:Leucine/isoleucine/valine transporter subunit ATP-binding component of ABC superfamily n=1 Tax=Thiomonas delicata TaxID=364030 RepID=A0A238D133_THIDL|nr:ABC transporter ATP-binding protein [Thiomonas delicata]SBP86978.1 leucine/isoleucine/valine transporter subunit; ATP-binding component of ABC superfamily [Thiomonas delicata]